jgi:hypothetical protein
MFLKCYAERPDLVPYTGRTDDGRVLVEFKFDRAEPAPRAFLEAVWSEDPLCLRVQVGRKRRMRHVGDTALWTVSYTKVYRLTRVEHSS